MRFRSSFLKVAIVAGLISPVAHAQETTFVNVGGGLLGTYPIFAAKLVELVNEDVAGARAKVVPGDSEPAQIQLETGELQFNIAYTWLTKKIYDGNGGLGIPTPKARHVVTLYGSMLQMIAQPDTITSLAEADDQPLRVWTGPEGFIFSQLILPALEANGVTPQSIRNAGGVTETGGYGNQLQAYQDGNLDVAFFAGGLPYGPLQQVENNPGFELVSMSDESIAKMMEMLPGVDTQVIPAGTYEGQDEDVQAIHFVNHLTTSADVPEEIVYQVTKLMNERYSEFHGLFPGSEEIDDIDPLANNDLPLHPGAERYYREVGIID